ncbi:uncharacterized protein HMPREF1541_00304 [Cyphellophora europaea CBS 101466]|uniref:RING-type domain-containing protein n=1 Tax=Cyphellophora europaea (strain CBS 101466) TaxID=1220924 RepID=W2SBY0_CYPE1|nr:uncharacterized protein HMPREF1541_00304 [Cyphellophora europaea CBS 101466]ETN46120.1 hypothetical protein HMPREF1541_00304 [Cyphellophora europaea CBS 101466]
MDSQIRSPVLMQHMSPPHILTSSETSLVRSMPASPSEESPPPADILMAATVHEPVLMPSLTAEARAAEAAPESLEGQPQAENDLRPTDVTHNTEITPEGRPQAIEEQSPELTDQPQQPVPQEEEDSRVADSPSAEQPTEPSPPQLSESTSEESPSPTPNHPEQPSEPAEDGAAPAPSPQETSPEESETAAPPPQPEVPEWVTWEDDLSTPTEEELEAVKDSEAENDATNVAAYEKHMFPDHDDPDQRPYKKVRLSWIIKGVRGTRERPNMARTMNSPAACIDGLYWTIKFFPRGNKCSSLSAYIQCSKDKPEPDKEVVESTFAYFEGPPDADLGRTAEPTSRIKVEATPVVKPEDKSPPQETTKEASASNDTASDTDEIQPAVTSSLSEEDKDFRASAQLGMVMYNPEEPRTATYHTSEHQFNPNNCDWGWTNFVGKWEEIHIRHRGERQPLLRNDTIGIDAYIRIFDDPSQALWWHSSDSNEPLWPSKLLAGYLPMGTPPLYHSPAVACITTWMLLAPFRYVIQSVDTGKWRSDSQIKPRPFIARLQQVAHQMRHLKDDVYVNVYPAVETLRQYGETYNDVLSFWEVFRRAIELELDGETELLRQLAAIFEVSGQQYHLPALPVRGVGDVQTALSMIKQPADLPSTGPDFLPLMLEREAFDKISREWKMYHDLIHLNDNITLPFGQSTDYTLYGFVVHVGARNSGRFYSILRPNGPNTKWLAFEDGDGNKIFSYTRNTIKEYEGLTGHELDNFNSTRQTAYMALYIKTERLKEYLPGKLEDYNAPQWLMNSAEDVEETPETIAFEVYHDTGAIGRQGLLDMFNLKQFSGDRGSFRSWALPSKTTIQELREQLACSMGLRSPEHLRVLNMTYGELGHYDNAMWGQLTLTSTLGSLATDVRPLCLWTSTLQTEEDVKLFKMPEPIVPDKPSEESSSDESRADAASEEATAESADDETRDDTAPREPEAEAPANETRDESTPREIDDEASPTNPSQPATNENEMQPPADGVQPASDNVLSRPASDSTAGENAFQVNAGQAASQVAAQIVLAQDNSNEVAANQSSDAVAAGVAHEASPQEAAATSEPATVVSAVEEPAVPQTPAETTEAPIAEALTLPSPATAPQVSDTPSINASDSPESNVVAPNLEVVVGENYTASDAPETPRPVEHGHLIDAVLSEPESANDAAVIEQVVTLVAGAQATVPEHGTSAEDEAAIAALIAADAAELSGRSVQNRNPSSDESPTPARETIEPQPPTEAAPEAQLDTPSPPSPEAPTTVPCTYAFLQFFSPTQQTFTVHRTFFAARSAPVRSTIRSLLSYPEDRAFNVWYRTTAVDGAKVGEGETFYDIQAVDGFDIIVGDVLPEDEINRLRSEGKFWEPFGLSKFLRMQQRRYPYAITTSEGAEVEIKEFGGEYYKGPLANGRQHGLKCELIYANGQSYVGPLQCQQRHGKDGRMTYQNGDVYEGEWKNDEQHGQGTFVQKRTGNKYVGGFRDGKRWGKGTTHWEVADEEADLCQICYGEEIDALFYDCGHVCACVDCAKQCETCPICRRSVRHVVRMWRV